MPSGTFWWLSSFLVVFSRAHVFFTSCEWSLSTVFRPPLKFAYHMRRPCQGWRASPPHTGIGARLAEQWTFSLWGGRGFSCPRSCEVSFSCPHALHTSTAPTRCQGSSHTWMLALRTSSLAAQTRLTFGNDPVLVHLMHLLGLSLPTA